jgi:hypothetical protein
MAAKGKSAAHRGGTTSGKRRTREHVIAALSMNFVERLVLKCGYVVQRCDPDYGYDLRLETFDEQGQLEPEHVPLQLKATDTLREYALATEAAFSFPISAKDYRLWSDEVMPVFLILYDAAFEEAYWLHVQEYDRTERPKVEGDAIRVRIPRHQVLGVEIIRMMRGRKQEVLRTISEALRRKQKHKET